MTLQDFLATANADHATALTEAHAFELSQGKMITSDVITMLLVQYGLYDVFSDIAETNGHPARGICMAFMDRVRTNSVFNFQPDSQKGAANLAMVDLLSSLLPDHNGALMALKYAAIDEAGDTVKPFANVTLHEILKERDVMPTASVVINGRHAVITTLADCPKHNPRLMAQSPNTGLWSRVNSFSGVSVAGAYECVIPPEVYGLPLAADDPYGVM